MESIQSVMRYGHSIWCMSMKVCSGENSVRFAVVSDSCLLVDLVYCIYCPVRSCCGPANTEEIKAQRTAPT